MNTEDVVETWRREAIQEGVEQGVKQGLEVQIRLLARFLTGEIDEYPPFATR